MKVSLAQIWVDICALNSPGPGQLALYLQGEAAVLSPPGSAVQGVSTQGTQGYPMGSTCPQSHSLALSPPTDVLHLGNYKPKNVSEVIAQINGNSDFINVTMSSSISHFSS